jgi:two-component system, NarL family, sensor kinase
LSSAVEVAAYRIVLEAVTNVARHASAGQCTVVVTVSDGSLFLAVTDNGCGLPTAGQPQGLGLRSMAERAAELGGVCTIGVAGDQGTRVVATMRSRRARSFSAPAWRLGRSPSSRLPRQAVVRPGRFPS